jgi:rRNA maturation RNase YbeY
MLVLFQKYEEETRRVIAHGILHLCGYKDKTEEQQKEMRAKEDFYLNIF